LSINCTTTINIWTIALNLVVTLSVTAILTPIIVGSGWSTWIKRWTNIVHSNVTCTKWSIATPLVAYVVEIAWVTRDFLYYHSVRIYYMKSGQYKNMYVPLFPLVTSHDTKMVDIIRRTTKERTLVLFLVSSIWSVSNFLMLLQLYILPSWIVLKVWPYGCT
jgi:hypothetical protein